MATVEKHRAGDFCWVELATSDDKAAGLFYSAVFGWERDELPAGQGTYTMWKVGGRELGAMYRLTAEIRQRGIPPHWLTYIAVENAEATLARAVQLGGKRITGPHEVPGAGKSAVLLDPAGAMFAIWEAKGHIGSRVVDEDGVRTWSELATGDAASAAAFYTGLFGWSTKVDRTGPIEYTEWLNGGRPVGGMFQMTNEYESVPAHWMPYFRVSNCDHTAALVQEAGGAVRVAPADIPSVGRFAMLADPQGAAFSVIEPAL